MLRGVTAAALVVLNACAGGPTPGVQRPMPRGVVVHGSLTRYPIDGRTVAEIGRALNQARAEGGGFAAHYRATWRWRYRMGETGTRAGCRLQDVRIDIQSQIRSPDWRRPSDAPTELVQAWETFSTALEDHEREHERIAIEAAGELVRRLERMTELSCRQLQLEAQNVAAESLRQMRERQAQLDHDTRHGATTGARWPPRPAPPSPRGQIQ